MREKLGLACRWRSARREFPHAQCFSALLVDTDKNFGDTIFANEGGGRMPFSTVVPFPFWRLPPPRSVYTGW